METAQAPKTVPPASPPAAPPRVQRDLIIRGGVITALIVAVIIVLPQVLSLYYIDAMTQVSVYAVVALGLGVLVGRVGLEELEDAAVLVLQRLLRLELPPTELRV